MGKIAAESKKGPAMNTAGFLPIILFFALAHIN
jgi:hypothetical protein